MEHFRRAKAAAKRSADSSPLRGAVPKKERKDVAPGSHRVEAELIPRSENRRHARRFSAIVIPCGDGCQPGNPVCAIGPSAPGEPLPEGAEGIKPGCVKITPNA